MSGRLCPDPLHTLPWKGLITVSRLSNAMRTRRETARARKNFRTMFGYSPTVRDEVILVAHRDNGLFR